MSLSWFFLVFVFLNYLCLTKELHHFFHLLNAELITVMSVIGMIWALSAFSLGSLSCSRGLSQL